MKIKFNKHALKKLAAIMGQGLKGHIDQSIARNEEWRRKLGFPSRFYRTKKGEWKMRKSYAKQVNQ